MKLTLKEKLVIQTIFRESFHYLLVEETNVGEKISQMLFSWQCSFPQLFQTPLSKKIFQNSVKYMMYLTPNLKSHIEMSVMPNSILELVPIKPSILWWLLAFSGHVGWEESTIQKVCVHTCCDTCHPAPHNLANENSLPDDKDIALASMKSRGERVTTKDEAPNSNTIAAAALGIRPSIHSSERLQHVQKSLVDSMRSGYPALVHRAPLMVSFLRATVEPGAHMKPGRVDQNEES